MRVKGGGSPKKYKKLFKYARGYYAKKKNVLSHAKEQVPRSLAFAYRHRREKKRAFRRLWNVRINAAAREHGLSYSRLMAGLRKAGVELDRKQLSELALADPPAFRKLAETARTQEGGAPAPAASS